MLPLMLMLVADPLTPAPVAPAAPGVRMIDAEGTMLAVNQTVDAARAQCRNGQFQQAANPAALQRGARVGAGDLMFRQGDPVQMTLLLERRIGQCSVPISYDVAAPEGRLPSFPARPQ